LTAIGHFEVPIAPDHLTSESLTLTTASAFRQVRFFPFQRSLALISPGLFVELMGDSPDNLVKEAT